MDDVTRRKFLAAAGAVAAIGAANAAMGAEAQPKGIKIIGVNTSYRKGKTTAAALTACLAAAKEAGSGIETELIELADFRIDGGIAAGAGNPQGDDFGKIQEKLADPKVAGMIVGSPVYFGNMSSLCKAFFERCMELRKTWTLRNKVGAALTVGGARNGGQEFTIHSMHACLYAQDMIVVGDGRPNAHMGATLWNQKDDVSKDEWGLNTAKNLGKRVAEMALKLAGA